MLGATALLRQVVKRCGTGIVLFGHGVSKESSDLHINLAQLRQSLEYCTVLGLEFITMKRLIELSQEGFPPCRPWVHLTFDDGYENNYTHLHPMLQDMGIPWTLFVSTYHAATGVRFYNYVLQSAILHARVPVQLPGVGERLPADAPPRRRQQYFRLLRYKALGRGALLDLVEQARALLSDDQWRELDRIHCDEAPINKDQLRRLAADPLVHIGSHCHRHVILNNEVTRDEAAMELAESKRWLEKEIRVQVVAFCYPNGQPGEFSPMTRQLCVETGYRVAFTTVRSAVLPGTDPYYIPRRAVAPTFARTRRKLARMILRSVWTSRGVDGRA